MMRDHSDDPAHRWSALLKDLIGRQRDNVVKALRNSVESGFPADADGVRILVAYAQGHISARQYVAQMLETLGFRQAAYVPKPPNPAPWHSVRDADPWRAPARTEDPWHDVLSASFTPPAASPPQRRESGWSEGDTITQSQSQSRGTRREQAVQDYLSGLIPMEEFLRLTYGG